MAGGGGGEQWRRQPSKTRSGGRYGLRNAVDDEEGLARGDTRGGSTFRRVSRGHYSTMATLKKAHARLFSQEAVFVLSGGYNTASVDERVLTPPLFRRRAELPVDGIYTGIAQGVLRINASASDEAKRDHLRRAYKLMAQQYQGKTFYATVTANVVLRSTLAAPSFSVYFGQSFGSARAVFLGQEHDDETGHLRSLFREFAVDSRSDAEQLPLRFTAEDFDAIYRRNFARSNVVVHRVVSLVYLFSLGLENYHDDHQLERRPLRLF